MAHLNILLTSFVIIALNSRLCQSNENIVVKWTVDCRINTKVAPCSDITPLTFIIKPDGFNLPNEDNDIISTNSTACDPDQMCDCESIEIIDIRDGAEGLTECSGFDRSNATEVDELNNVFTDSCAINATGTQTVKKDGKDIVRNVTVCLSDPSIKEEEDNKIFIISFFSVLTALVLLIAVLYLLDINKNKNFF